MISELSLSLLLLIIPLVSGGGIWFYKEFNQTQCAFQSFTKARRQVIATHLKATTPIFIGGMTETVTLYALEDLDLKKSALGPLEWGSEATQLWEDASHSLRRLQDLDSSGSYHDLKI